MFKSDVSKENQPNYSGNDCSDKAEPSDSRNYTSRNKRYFPILKIPAINYPSLNDRQQEAKQRTY